MFRSLFVKLGLGWLGGEIRAMAEGKRGASAKAIYDALQGRKTAIGVVLAIVTAGLAALDLSEPLTLVSGTLATLLVSVGLADKAWRSRPPYWESRTWFVFVRNHAADIGVLLAGLETKFSLCAPGTATLVARIHLSCHAATVLATLAVAAFGWLVAEGKVAAPPRPQGSF